MNKSILYAATAMAALIVSPALAQFSLVDDFQSYTVANFSPANPTSGTWTPNAFPTGLVAIEEQPPNQYLAFGWNSGARGAWRSIPNIADGGIGTYFFQVRSLDATPDVSYGLSDVAAPAAFGDFEVQIALLSDGGSTYRLAGRNGVVVQTLATGLTIDTWYNVWLLVNNTTDTFDVYFSAGNDPGAQVGTDLAFRNGTSTALTSFWALANNHNDRQAHLDNIYFNPLLDGVTNPIPEPSALALLGLGGLGLVLRRRFRRA